MLKFVLNKILDFFIKDNSLTKGVNEMEAQLEEIMIDEEVKVKKFEEFRPDYDKVNIGDELFCSTPTGKIYTIVIQRKAINPNNGNCYALIDTNNSVWISGRFGSYFLVREV